MPEKWRGFLRHFFVSGRKRIAAPQAV